MIQPHPVPSYLRLHAAGALHARADALASLHALSTWNTSPETYAQPYLGRS